VGAATLCSTIGVVAHAEPVGLELAWTAPPECPTRDEVLDAIQQLLGGREAAKRS
jgi:hypothetical protein